MRCFSSCCTSCCSVGFVVEGEGFEPSKSETTDLQSVPFGHSGTPPSEPGTQGGLQTSVTPSPSVESYFFARALSSRYLSRSRSWRWDSNPQPADYKSAA